MPAALSQLWRRAVARGDFYGAAKRITCAADWLRAFLVSRARGLGVTDLSGAAARERLAHDTAAAERGKGKGVRAERAADVAGRDALAAHAAGQADIRAMRQVQEATDALRARPIPQLDGATGSPALLFNHGTRLLEYRATMLREAEAAQLEATQTRGPMVRRDAFLDIAARTQKQLDALPAVAREALGKVDKLQLTEAGRAQLEALRERLKDGAEDKIE